MSRGKLGKGRNRPRIQDTKFRLAPSHIEPHQQCLIFMANTGRKTYGTGCGMQSEYCNLFVTMFFDNDGIDVSNLDITLHIGYIIIIYW